MKSEYDCRGERKRADAKKRLQSENFGKMPSRSRPAGDFWKTAETIAGRMLGEFLSKRCDSAKESFDELLEIAYREDALPLQKAAAGTLLHLIIFICVQVGDQDGRLAGLAYDVWPALLDAKSTVEVAAAAEMVFSSLCEYLGGSGLQETIHPAVRHVVRYLEENYRKKVRLEDVARYVHMSPEYVCRLFKKETGHTILRYLSGIRMRRVRELLLETTLPVKDIASATGYSDLRSFYKAFARHYGMTTTELRIKKGGL